MNTQIYINLYENIYLFYLQHNYILYNIMFFFNILYILYPHFSINNVELSSEVKSVNDKRDGLFDVKTLSKVPQTALKSETIINCQLVIPNTNYTKKRETVYYGKTGY